MQKALTIHFCHFDSLSVSAWRTRLLNSVRPKILPELGLLRLHPWVDSRVTYLHTFYSQRFRRSKCPQEKIDPWSVDLILKKQGPSHEIRSPFTGHLSELPLCIPRWSGWATHSRGENLTEFTEKQIKSGRPRASGFNLFFGKFSEVFPSRMSGSPASTRDAKWKLRQMASKGRTYFMTGSLFF